MHAESGRYKAGFNNFLRDTSQGDAWEEAWVRQFTNDPQVFEQGWRSFWRGLPDDPTHDVYAEAVVRTLTVYLARARSQGQVFATPGELFAAGQGGRLRQAAEEWLPPRLVDERVKQAMKLGTWTLRTTGNRVELLCDTNKGFLAGGAFEVKDGRVENLRVKVQDKNPNRRR